MARVLVIGYGNALRGDDGLGVIVADRLATQYTGEDSVRILAVHQLLPELAEAVSLVDLVIFIDAREGDAPPGTIDIQPIVGRLDRDKPQTFSHHVDAAGLIAAAAQLYGHGPQGELCTVVGKAYGYGEGLSSEVEAVVPIVLKYVCEKIKVFMEN
jgi:hydrogenase maturation protease